MKYEKPSMEMLQIGDDVITTSGTLAPGGNSGTDVEEWEAWGL